MTLPKTSRNKALGTLRAILSIGAIAVTTNAKGETTTGCSFYKAPYAATFLSCANPTATFGGCTKTRYVAGVPVKYPAVKLEMWLPEYLIEVTEKPGVSKFSHLSPSLGYHLDVATDWYRSKAQGGDLTSGQGGISETGKTFFWHARGLEIPYGRAVFSYPHMRASGAVAAPLCYTSISELVPDLWHLGLSELALSKALMPISLPLCYADAVGASSSLSEGIEKAKKEVLSAFTGSSDIDTGMFSGTNCARPVSNQIAAMKTVSGDAARPENLCMNALGPLLPRVGQIDGDTKYQTAVIASWKFSSLTKDMFNAQNFGILGSDKWQMMHPRSSRIECFKPGTAHSDYLGGPTEYRLPGEANDGHYVFGVWRKREACEDLNGPLWKSEVLALAKTNKAACAAVK